MSLDVDIEGFRNLDEVDGALQRAAVADLGDRFAFTVTRLGVGEGVIGQVGTYRVAAIVGGRIFAEIRADVQVGTRRNVVADSIIGPDYLSFVGIDASTYPALPVSVQIAEKVHAYTRRYDRDRQSTRVKDLVDIVLVASNLRHTVNTAQLALDLEMTFSDRATHALPQKLPSPPAAWATPYRREARELGISESLADAYRVAAELVDPALRILADGGLR